METYAFGSFFFSFFSKIRDDFLIVMDCVYLCTCKGVPIYILYMYI